MASTPVVDVERVLDALEAWIKQKPGLDPANYGLATGQYQSRNQYKEALASYRAEVRQIGKDRKRALKALAEAQECIPHRPELLADAFSAFSGRLEWVPEYLNTVDALAGKAPTPGHLTYTTGQYWPTEYRKAAATVLERYVSSWRRAWAEEHPTTYTYRTIEDVKRANAAEGYHWFEPATMRFFNSRIESSLYAGRYFITSERMDLDRAKRYTIREAKSDGGIDTVGEFQQYASLEDARRAVRELCK